MNPGNVVYRLAALAVLVVASLVYLSPLVLPADFPLPSFLQREPLHLGLDLRGGTHLLFAVDVEKAVENNLGRAADELRRELKDQKIQTGEITQQGKTLRLSLTSPDQRAAFDDLVKNRFPNLVMTSQSSDGPPVIELSPSPREQEQQRRFAIDQSLETIRNRIDQFGVSEPSIQRQGDQDIVVQLPGVQDPQRAKELIGKTAVLEFKLVADKTGAGTEKLQAANPLPGAASEYVLDKKVLMSGSAVADARVRPGTQLEGPYVELILSDRGAREFEAITGESVGRNLAIVLDGKVFSAPVIREKIGGGRASITGSFDIKEARDLAIVLRAGALPAPIKIAEERTVGPSLGRDSIRQGIVSLLVGGALVVLFMVFYYRGAGLLADGALVLNVLFMMAILAAFGATLTLPGIAGVVLTLGMAVDANVLINERIREELRTGKTARAALEAGYDRAWAAIRDSNITTLISGLILFQFGSGPVKGFAVTLCVGLVTTVFTAVFVTRMYYDWQLSRRQLLTVSV
ncbi:MAG: protein translocase subunit SecD [Deltaproteobacteria bacterium]|nr:protein translocase subunit SecD [Deltaproteobacteria bacterium]